MNNKVRQQLTRVVFNQCLLEMRRKSLGQREWLIQRPWAGPKAQSQGVDHLSPPLQLWKTLPCLFQALVAPSGPWIGDTSLPSLSSCSILCLCLKTPSVSFISTLIIELGIEAHAYNLNTQEAKAGELLQYRGQLGPQSKFKVGLVYSETLTQPFTP